jgi:hypothetical protein
MSDITKLVKKYDVYGDAEDLEETREAIADKYVEQRSEEVIEDLEREIDGSEHADDLYDAINKRYLEPPPQEGK